MTSRELTDKIHEITDRLERQAGIELQKATSYHDGRMNRKRLSKLKRQEIYAKCQGHCAYCECEIDIKDMQVDHVVPLRKGGADSADNMLPACRSCNHYKATLTAEEYRDYVTKIPDRLLRDSIPYQVGVRFGIIKTDSTDMKFYYERNSEK